MAILNYSTTIDPYKTATEIQRFLAGKGAEKMMIDYRNSDPIAIAFQLTVSGRLLAFRLPVNTMGVFAVMKADKRIPKSLKNERQATRCAWRILKDWVQAQMAIIESGQANVAEVFCPYLLTDDGRTVFERITTDPTRMLGTGQ